MKIYTVASLTSIFILFYSFTAFCAETRFVDKDTYESKVQVFDEVVDGQLKILRMSGVKVSDVRSIKFSFATDEKEKAQKLMLELANKGCEVSLKPSESMFTGKMLYFIRGNSPKLQMSDQKIIEWIKLAMNTAFGFDCEYSTSSIDGIVVGKRP